MPEENKVERVFYYNEIGHQAPIRKTESEIINENWGWWKEKMIKKFGVGHKFITEENCLYDWAAIHWAWEN